jgi:HSP20 family protein
MTIKKDKKEGAAFRVEGILSGLAEIVEKLGELAEKGEQLSKSGVVEGKDKNLKAVYGFSMKMGLGQDGKPKVEPFGNVRKDERSGESFVQEVREPMVDVFEESDHTLVVVEMPGISEEDLRIDFKDDLLEIYAEKGDKKYRKEVLLPKAYTKEKAQISCNNGILEIKCMDD